MLEDTKSLGQLSVKDHLVYVQGHSEKQGASIIRQGTPLMLHGPIPHVGGLEQRPHHQLSHIGLGSPPKKTMACASQVGGGLPLSRWARAAALGSSCSSTEKMQLSEGQAWCASTRPGHRFWVRNLLRVNSSSRLRSANSWLWSGCVQGWVLGDLDGQQAGSLGRYCFPTPSSLPTPHFSLLITRRVHKDRKMKMNIPKALAIFRLLIQNARCKIHRQTNKTGRTMPTSECIDFCLSLSCALDQCLSVP